MANVLLRGYQDIEFLAHKLEKVFSFIKNERDMALHNDMLDDIRKMIGKNNDHNFRSMVARAIIDLGNKDAAKEKN